MPSPQKVSKGPGATKHTSCCYYATDAASHIPRRPHVTLWGGNPRIQTIPSPTRTTAPGPISRTNATALPIYTQSRDTTETHRLAAAHPPGHSPHITGRHSYYQHNNHSPQIEPRNTHGDRYTHSGTQSWSRHTHTSDKTRNLLPQDHLTTPAPSTTGYRPNRGLHETRTQALLRPEATTAPPTQTPAIKT